MQFQISSRRKNWQRDRDILMRLEFLEKLSANNFALSDAEENTSEPLNRGGGIARLPLLRTLLPSPQSQVSGK